MHNIFFELTLAFTLASAIALITSFLKQPAILAYIITGLILGPLGYRDLSHQEIFQGLSQIGITLLLFMVGMELDISQLKTIGKTALITGFGQVAITSVLGFLLLRFLGFPVSSAMYIAPALTFSSTIIIVKLLTQKKDLQSLYGKIVIGVFLVQDFVAVCILLSLGSLDAGAGSLYQGLPLWMNMVFLAVRALILGLLVLWIANKVLPAIINKISKSEELLLIFSLAWALGLAAFVSLPFMGFSLEIGGFLAGLALARSVVHFEISARIKPLRDFFLILFFIILGSGFGVKDMFASGGQAAMLSLFVLIGNPLIVMLLLAWQGYKPRTGLLAGVTVAQISEFSLILASMGAKLGYLSQKEVGLVTSVGLLTIAVSSYMILYADKLYEVLKKPLGLLDFKKGSAEKNFKFQVLEDHVVLVGVHRMGKHLVEVLKKSGRPFVLVDFNPEIVEHYFLQGLQAVCGDIADPYIQEMVNLPKARLVISTVPDINDNLSLIDAVRKNFKRNRPRLIFTAQDEQEAKTLYGREIDYVISPHFMSGLHLAKILEDERGFRSLKKLREGHLKILKL